MFENVELPLADPQGGPSELIAGVDPSCSPDPQVVAPTPNSHRCWDLLVVLTRQELLEYAQQCKYEGNEKFREGLYEEALFIYSQGDEAMRRWIVEGKSLKNEHKWLTDNRLACLKNKAQAALRLELFQTALEAAGAALALDDEDDFGASVGGPLRAPSEAPRRSLQRSRQSPPALGPILRP